MTAASPASSSPTPPYHAPTFSATLNGVSLVAPLAFTAFVSGPKLKEAEANFLELNASGATPSPGAKRRRSAAHRLPRLWSPFDRRLVVAGIALRRGGDAPTDVARGADIATELSRHWMPTTTASKSTLRAPRRSSTHGPPRSISLMPPHALPAILLTTSPLSRTPRRALTASPALAGMLLVSVVLLPSSSPARTL
jgi:hypothetical protein